jgi:NAD(P)-dependent dehydrogenase (short-subunit alcohol dehydrogenase family)
MIPAVSLPFSGRTAIVTGSGKNIGRAMALSLAAQGANVVVNGHQDRAAVDAVVEEIKASAGQAMGFMADVSEDLEVAEMVKATVAQYGSVDIAVSNVGIRHKQAFLDISPEDWDSVMQTNLTPAFYVARHVIPHMQAKRWGRIVLISGFDGFWGQVTERAHNITAKAGLHGLAMASQLTPFRRGQLIRCVIGLNIRINCVPNLKKKFLWAVMANQMKWRLHVICCVQIAGGLFRGRCFMSTVAITCIDGRNILQALLTHS